MDTLQKQVTTLSSKVDALFQITEQLSTKISDAVLELKLVSNQQRTVSSVSAQPIPYTYQNYTRANSVETDLEHKDVLSDAKHFAADEHTGGERELAPEIQIRRLTAQLTAAYNRIAALEEQLLAQRIHS